MMNDMCGIESLKATNNIAQRGALGRRSINARSLKASNKFNLGILFVAFSDGIPLYRFPSDSRWAILCVAFSDKMKDARWTILSVTVDDKMNFERIIS
ncbi:MAG: hypothetical protein JST84_17285 [Acidobacteria bacterium]|nr:hypothetical protein [Acidobacteriota bacterium]